VYSNGSNPGIPASNAATLNYVSEVGFICKPQTIDGTSSSTASDQIDDPATGGWYENEIDLTILTQGFIPIDAGGGSTYSTLTFPTAAAASEGSVPHNAASMLANPSIEPYGASYLDAAVPGGSLASSANTSINTAANPPGFCAVSSTDLSSTNQ
jgi:hypothetical protein